MCISGKDQGGTFLGGCDKSERVSQFEMFHRQKDYAVRIEPDADGGAIPVNRETSLYRKT
jgi:hypothetical protein